MTFIRSGPLPASTASAGALRRWTWLAASLLACCALVGCQKEDVHEYEALRVDVTRSKPSALPTRVRLLAVIAPQGEELWFFKFLGPVDEVNEQSKNFHTLVDSLRFDGKTVKWKLPEGWQEDGPREKRQATLHAGPRGRSPQVSVFKLPKSPLLENVNRWRIQDLGLPPIGEAELAKFTQTLTLGTTKLTKVDMIGLGPRRRAPMAKGPPIKGPAGGMPLTYKAQPGWEERPSPATLTSFTVRDGDRSALVTISQLSRDFGGMRLNVKRWREQVGLGPLPEAEFDRLTFPEVIVDTIASKQVDVSGPGGRLVVVVTPHLDSTYFFKIKGDKAVVEKEKPAFEAFLKSVKFRADRGADDE